MIQGEYHVFAFWDNLGKPVCLNEFRPCRPTDRPTDFFLRQTTLVSKKKKFAGRSVFAYFSQANPFSFFKVEPGPTGVHLEFDLVFELVFEIVFEIVFG